MPDAIFPLIEYAARIKTEEIPPQVIAYTRDLFLDALACMLSGSSAAGVAELREVIGNPDGKGHARIFSFKENASMLDAAFLNAVMCHANDYDDTHDPAVNHGCVTIVPALLALSEMLKVERGVQVDGKEFLAALAVGLDVSNRLGMAFIRYLHVGWLPTTLWGPFGSAAACGRLLGFDAHQLQNAFGLAYSQIHGNRQGLVDGVLSKRIQPAFSAVAGLRAALFAEKGITGARNIIDGEFGIPALYTGGQIDRACLSEGLGELFETSKISIKPYPCCRCSHPVIDAALALRGDHGISWQEIENGLIHLPPQSMGQIGNPFQIRGNPTVDAQFSAQYTAALAFRHGWPRVSDFEPTNILERREIVELAKRFKVVAFAPDSASIVPVEMEIELTNGKSLETRVEAAKGSPANPMTEAEQATKFTLCLENSIRSFSEMEGAAILSMIRELPPLADMTELIALL